MSPKATDSVNTYIRVKSGRSWLGASRKVVMHKLMVLYPEPNDRDHFRNYYVSTHVPLVRTLPGLLRCHYSFDVSATAGVTPYFAIFEADFIDAAAMETARSSPQGKLVADDVANYATGGAVVLHYSVPDEH